ncbi:hypothetical protein ACHAPE_005276 [Trichoderma viride]
MRKSSFLGSLKGKVRAALDGESERGESKNSLAPNNPFADPDDAPPAYSAVASSSSAPPPQAKNSEDKYAFLASFDTIFLIDDSASMRGENWREVADVLLGITEICTARDEDGIDLYFLNHRSDKSHTVAGKAMGGYYGIDTPEKVHMAFKKASPRGGTPTGQRLEDILDPYIARLVTRKRLAEKAEKAKKVEKVEKVEKVKPINIIVITDGSPSDDPERVILQYARKLDMLNAPSHQVGIQFFQIGNEMSASKALKDLDDELVKQQVRDMVDTVTWDGESSDRSKKLTAEGILKVVLGAVVRRLDRTNIQETR